MEEPECLLGGSCRLIDKGGRERILPIPSEGGYSIKLNATTAIATTDVPGPLYRCIGTGGLIVPQTESIFLDCRQIAQPVDACADNGRLFPCTEGDSAVYIAGVREILDQGRELELLEQAVQEMFDQDVQ